VGIRPPPMHPPAHRQRGVARTSGSSGRSAAGGTTPTTPRCSQPAPWPRRPSTGTSTRPPTTAPAGRTRRCGGAGGDRRGIPRDEAHGANRCPKSLAFTVQTQVCFGIRTPHQESGFAPGAPKFRNCGIFRPPFGFHWDPSSREGGGEATADWVGGCPPDPPRGLKAAWLQTPTPQLKQRAMVAHPTPKGIGSPSTP